MHELGIATSLALIAALGPFFAVGPGRGKPPEPFNERVTLPGKVPPTPKSLSGAWQFGYSLQDATLEGGKSGTLIVGTMLSLREDGTYDLHYHARWNGLDGRNVSESGRYSLSGEVLLLEPGGTTYGDLENNTMVNQQAITSEKHAWIVRLDKARLIIAGRCASYQVDPVCRTTPVVWYPMKAQAGGRWVGREPR